MSGPAPPTPLQRLAVFVRVLTHAVVTRNLYFQVLATVQASWVIARLQTLQLRFQRLAGRIANGTYKPRRPFTRRPPETAKPPPRRVVPRKRGWLAEQLPEAAQLRGHLRDMLNDPETVKLIQAAPAEMARILRPLCWMLKFKPPPILALPRRPRPAPAPDAAAARPPPAPEREGERSTRPGQRATFPARPRRKPPPHAKKPEPSRRLGTSCLLR